MLSFMREQGAGDPSANQTKVAAQRQSKSAEDSAQEYLTVATNSKTLRRSTMLVAVLVAIGLLCLWFMIRKSQPQAASAKPVDTEEISIEGAIGRLTGISSEMVTKMDQILKKFYEFSNVLQVQVGELSKNPFEVEVFAKDIKPETALVRNDEEHAAMIRRERLKQRASTLGLLSVMQTGGANSCMINDKILQQGDMIEGFVITKIGSDYVELSWRGDNETGSVPPAENDESKIVLKLSQ